MRFDVEPAYRVDRAAELRVLDVQRVSRGIRADRTVEHFIGDGKAAKAAEAATLKAEQTKEESYRSQYPGSLHFDYAWDKSKGKELGL